MRLPLLVHARACVGDTSKRAAVRRPCGGGVRPICREAGCPGVDQVDPSRAATRHRSTCMYHTRSVVVALAALAISACSPSPRPATVPAITSVTFAPRPTGEWGIDGSATTAGYSLAAWSDSSVRISTS